MSLQSAVAQRWQELRQLPGRVPLRVKMITVLLALVAFALVAISIAGISFLRSYLLSQADTTLAAEGQTLAPRQVQDCLSGFPCPGAGAPGTAIDWQPAGGSLHKVLVPVRGFVMESNAPRVPGPAVRPSLQWLDAHPGQATTVPAESGSHRWRVVAYPARIQTQAGQVVGTIITAYDVTSVYNTVGRLLSIDLTVSGVVLLALAIVGVATVRSSLRPLTDIEHTAEAIAAGDLSRRVPDRDPQTEVGRLGRSLNAMLAQVEAAFTARATSEAAARRSEERMRQFIADASHELRTPVTVIRGYAEYYRQRGGLNNGARGGEQPADGGELAAGSNGAPAAGAPAPEQATAATAVVATPGSAVTPGISAAPGGAATPGISATPGGAATPGTSAAPGGAMPRTGPAHTEPATTMPAGTDSLTRLDMDRIMERVEQESARMGGLVEDLLLLARLDQQRPVERRLVDLLVITGDAVQDARTIAPGRKISLTVGTGAPFLVLGDEPRLRQVISNLMSNALTHTPAGTPIDVRIFTQDSGGSLAGPSVIAEIADQGPGLAKEQADRVFERFYRADQARDRRTGGTGLGLAIVSALVAAHGGTVGVDTSLGHGATFRITLPLAPEAQGHEELS